MEKYKLTFFVVTEKRNDNLERLLHSIENQSSRIVVLDSKAELFEDIWNILGKHDTEYYCVLDENATLLESEQ